MDRHGQRRPDVPAAEDTRKETEAKSDMMRTFQTEFGGRPLILETGQLAQQANGSVLVRYGDTVVLVTATMSKEPRPGIDFFPLLVDYEERMYSIGKIPRVWLRREGRPTQTATLTARMIDRPLRPLFPDGFRHDVQVTATVLSVERDNQPGIAALIGASAALTISDIPFDGPVGGVHVGRVNGEFIINPTAEQAEESDLDLIVAGTRDAVMMVESAADELPESVMLDAIIFAHEEIKRLVDLQTEMREAVGKPKADIPLESVDEDLVAWIRAQGGGSIRDAVLQEDKLGRQDAVATVRDELMERYRLQVGDEAAAEQAKAFHDAFDRVLKDQVRRMITEEHLRPDGRGLDEIRPVSSQVGLLPRTHGSGLFTRGQTQVLSVLTLGLKGDEQLLDELSDEDRKRYIHHYNFPGYSTGEVRPMRSPGRREIGHGALAERALLPVIPDEETFPYTIRIVSEVLSSNGSSSMASVCGSSLALMDAGVPIKRPVAGIAMGLVKHGDRFAILSDIQGLEDALGDMDFKVAGTEKGVTALQMDIKISGVSRDILAAAFEQARAGRMFIMEKMLEAINGPRKDLSPYAPRIQVIRIPVDKIRDVIGAGGRVINAISEKTGATIDIQDDGRVYVASLSTDDGEQAIRMIEGIVKDVEVGEVYEGVVKRIMDFGAFVEILPGKEGLVHISQLASERVAKVEDVVNVGDEIEVKVIEIDPLGRINLSRKVLLPDYTPDERGQGNGSRRRGGEGRDGRGGRGPARERGRGPSGPGRGARR